MRNRSMRLFACMLFCVTMAMSQTMDIQTQTGTTSIKLSDIINITFSDSENETVTDIDGNNYRTVKIGNQVWMAENLKVTKYRNGELIPNVTGANDWRNLTSGAYCDYDNNQPNIDIYGRLYNWYAVSDIRGLAPEGWHVPSDLEWKQLEIFLGMSQSEADASSWRGSDQGGQLKESGYAHWVSPSTGATDKWNFTALPGGYRNYDGDYKNVGYFAIFWSSMEDYSNLCWYRALTNDYAGIYRYLEYKPVGYSVRCVRD